MKSEIPKILNTLSENINKWLKSDYISLVYFPSSEEEDTNYYMLLVLESNSEYYGVEFWIEYYKYVESHWDASWNHLSSETKVPLLSMNLRTKQSLLNKQVLSVSPEESFEIIFDKDNFFKNCHTFVITQDETSETNPIGDILWI
jgi:hypothetical protein